MATTSIMFAHDMNLPASPTLTNPDLILPFSSPDDRTAKTPSPPAQLLRAASSSDIRTTSSYGSDLSLRPAPYTRLILTPTPTEDKRMAFPVNGGRSRGDTVISSTNRSRTAEVTRLQNTPYDIMQARHKPERLIISSFDDDDDDDDEDEDEHDGNVDDLCLPVEDGLEGPIRSDGRRFPNLPVDSENAQPRSTDRTQESEDQFSSAMDENEDQFSSAALSLRAEKILANAKKRLDNMEGNLSRARSSLILSPSPSMSPSSWASRTPDVTRTAPTSISTSPYDGRTGAFKRAAIAASPARHRQQHSLISSANASGSPSHNRVFSETSVPSSLYSSIQSHSKEYNVARSRSVLGGNAGSRSPQMGSMGLSHSYSVRDTSRTPLHRDLSKVHQVDFHVGERNYLSSSPYTRYSPVSPEVRTTSRLDALPESEEPRRVNGTDQTLDDGIADDVSIEEPESPPGKLRRLSTAKLAQSNGQGLGLSRSQSTYHMRDVRDQMKDLKGRISSLQQRAREDSLRRRSLQSLRTESPFSAAEKWYFHGSHDSGGGNLSQPTRRGPSVARSGHGFGPAAVARELPSSRLDTQYGGPVRSTTPPHHQAYPEEYSLSSPITTEASTPTGGTGLGLSHEDRPDAFDYEHFFLHSRLGAYSKTSTTSLAIPSFSSPEPNESTMAGQEPSDLRSIRNKRSSTDSDSSVATAKGTPLLEPQSLFTKRRPSQARLDTHNQRRSISQQQTRPSTTQHQRQTSADSISTVATWATATEGSRLGSGGTGSSLGLAIDTADPLHRPVASPPHELVTNERSSVDVDEEAEHTPTASPTPRAWHVTSHNGPNAPVSAVISTSMQDIHDGGAPDGKEGVALEHLERGDRELIERIMEGIARLGGILASDDVELEEKIGLRERLEGAVRVLEEGIEDEACELAL